MLSVLLPTNRKAAGVKIYYKLFPFLHLMQSNILTIISPRGRFLTEITEKHEALMKLKKRMENIISEKNPLWKKCTR